MPCNTTQLRSGKMECSQQTLQNKDVGQSGQHQMQLKSYETGMFANLAMLANNFPEWR